MDQKGLVEMRSRENRKDVIAIVEMNNNMCLKSSSESEEMGTDERHWKNEQDLGMMLCKSKEVGGVKNDSVGTEWV